MSHQTARGPVLESRIHRAADAYLEEFYESGRSRQEGEEMARVNLTKAQVRGFETLAKSTPRFSEIINYIKNQAGKEARGKDQWVRVAPGLLSQLEDIEAKAKELGEGDPEKTLLLKLKLARGWAGQVVTHYLFSKAQQEAAGGQQWS